MPLHDTTWVLTTGEAGMRSQALIDFQKKHTALAKVLTGALFLALAFFLILGHD